MLSFLIQLSFVDGKHGSDHVCKVFSGKVQTSPKRLHKQTNTQANELNGSTQIRPKPYCCSNGACIKYVEVDHWVTDRTAHLKKYLSLILRSVFEQLAHDCGKNWSVGSLGHKMGFLETWLWRFPTYIFLFSEKYFPITISILHFLQCFVRISVLFLFVLPPASLAVEEAIGNVTGHRADHWPVVMVFLLFWFWLTCWF